MVRRGRPRAVALFSDLDGGMDLGQDRGFAQRVRRLKRELYDEYGFFYYVPMAESYAVQLPVTVSCSYGRCLFCDLNQGMRFRVLSMEEVAANAERLQAIHERDRRPPTRFLLAGGNPLVLGTEALLRIAGMVRSAFPSCAYISAFARADDVLRKTPAELEALRGAGYDRFCLGVESGSDRVLRYQEKGVGREENARAMAALEAAGIAFSVYVMLGLGGREMSADHVEGTASLLNAARPFELTVVTLVIFKGARLAERVRAREFRRLSPLEAMREGRDLLSRLTLSTVWNGTHKTNLFPIKGRIPLHRERLLQRLDEADREVSGPGAGERDLLRWRSWGVE